MIYRKARLLSLAGAATALCSMAQALEITPTATATDLADSLFLGFGGLTVTSATFSGSFGQAGTYLNTTATYGMPFSGIVLSSGAVSNYENGSNLSSNTTGSFGINATAAQETLLDPITGGGFAHFDVSQLDIIFDAAPDVTEVTFFGTFGSEEFPEFVGSSYIDGFGLFVNGTNVAGAVPSGGGTPEAININHPDFAPIPGTELDGVLAPNGNPVLRFDVPVIAGATNSFQILIADASDSAYDTTIWLASFFGGIDNINDGGSEFTPLLPANPPDPDTGEFIIELPVVAADEPFWIDPPVSVGFDYVVTGVPDLGFSSVTAPSLASVGDPDGYFVTVGETTLPLLPGAGLNFLSSFGVQPAAFQLSGISTDLMLDPADANAFPLSVAMNGSTAGASVSITPITVDVPAVPLPASLPLMLAGLGLLAWGRQRG